MKKPIFEFACGCQKEEYKKSNSGRRCPEHGKILMRVWLTCACGSTFVRTGQVYRSNHPVRCPSCRRNLQAYQSYCHSLKKRLLESPGLEKYIKSIYCPQKSINQSFQDEDDPIEIDTKQRQKIREICSIHWEIPETPILDSLTGGS